MENEYNGPNVKLGTEKMVQAMTEANTSAANALHRQVFREALRALVKLAKAEKLLEIKRDIALSVGPDSERVPTPPGSES